MMIVSHLSETSGNKGVGGGRGGVSPDFFGGGRGGVVGMGVVMRVVGERHCIGTTRIIWGHQLIKVGEGHA